MTNNLTRGQAVHLVGEAAVKSAERDICEPTNRVGLNESTQGDNSIEWKGSSCTQDRNGQVCQVSVYYYTLQADIDIAGDDLSSIDWHSAVGHYTVT